MVKTEKRNIDWCEGGMQLVDIDTNNVVDDDFFNPRMKYIMVRLDN